MEVTKLPRNLSWPVPWTKKYEFIPRVLEIKRDSSFFRLQNNRCMPPCSFIYSTYKLTGRKLDQSVKNADLVRQKKLQLVIDHVEEHITEAKTKLKELILSYKKMVLKNNKETDKCIKIIVDDIGTLKNLKKIYKRYIMACHSLLYIKDSMEEAVDTYGDAALFMKEAIRQAPRHESVHIMHWRYKELMQLREEVGKEAKQETEEYAVLVNDRIRRHQEYYKEASLLHISGKELDTAVRDLDCRISREEQFMYAAHAWNERAWRHYSFINLTLYDLIKYVIESRDHSPKVLEGSLWDKIQFIRREHMYNLEILRSTGNMNIKVDIGKLLQHPITMGREELETKRKKKEAKRSKTLSRKLRGEMRKRFKGHIPSMFKLLFKKLRIRLHDSVVTGRRLLDMFCSPEENPCYEYKIQC